MLLSSELVGWFAAVHARYLPTPPDLFVLQSQNREHDKTMSAQPETLTRMEEPSCRPVADREPRQKHHTLGKTTNARGEWAR